MEITYHLLSNYGIEVIIIPELDCRIYVLNPQHVEIMQQPDDVLAFANIQGEELTFKMVSKQHPNKQEIDAAIRWYSHQKTLTQRRSA